MKQPVHMRLNEEILAWADAYALVRGWSRTQVVEEALRLYRQDAGSGVPDLYGPAHERAAPGDSLGGHVSAGSSREAAVRSRPPVAFSDVRRAPERWGGCSEHPEAGAVLSRGQHWCAEPGCPRTARRLV